MTRLLVTSAVVSAAVVLTGCSGDPAPSSSAPASSSAATPAGATPTGAARSATTEPGAPTSAAPAASPGPARSTALPGPPPAAPSQPPVVEPPRPTAPAATTAGSLDQRALPTPSGWRTAVGDGADGGYVPNGSWVNARDARSTAQEILGLACRPVPASHPWPRSALEGTYRGPGGADGTGEVLEFATPQEASAFAAIYAGQARSCAGVADPVFVMTPLRTSPALVDRRVLAEDRSTWLEVVGVKGSRVTFLMLQERSGPTSPATIDAVVAELT